LCETLTAAAQTSIHRCFFLVVLIVIAMSEGRLHEGMTARS
jgi:hypothetical protein